MGRFPHAGPTARVHSIFVPGQINLEKTREKKKKKRRRGKKKKKSNIHWETMMENWA